MRSNVWAMPALFGLGLTQNIHLSQIEGVSAPRTVKHPQCLVAVPRHPAAQRKCSAVAHRLNLFPSLLRVPLRLRQP